ncbi:LexA family protein [Mogibacterium sp. CM50]|jgi:putative prophage lambdaCh01, repressor protein|uniref:LexA family protein n=1 Tax=Mogibacterium sp. CM50 TaxID=936375 RepID=UPI00027C4BEC|nr:S24 family peptidase [Mogibacterium sp. CM50]EJU23324.1 peptidase S24-like protein [Mogibacterium sp. CM50]MBB1548254.1 XRE family transcriptional regulator [Mogibacterium sp.]DAF25996.1 MAG TPA: Repressor protein CI [Caudoviricetes sp.]
MSTQLGNKKIMAKNIQYYMDLYNKTRNDICQDLGIKYTTFTDWIKANTYPRIDKIELMANYFNIEKSDLIEEHNKESVQSDRPLPSNIILPSAHKLPIMGTICAGDGVVCEDDYQGTFIVDIDVKADYCLKVHGDSMIGANIYDGDIVFISKSYDFVQDQIYAIERLDYNEASLKRVTQDGDTLILNPCNPEYHAMVTDYEEVRIIGRCVGVLHKYV